MKRLLLIGLCCLCLVGCGKKKEESKSNSNSNEKDSAIVEAKKNCCTDNAGIWYSSDTCLAGESGYFDRDGYNSCVEYAIGSTN